MLDLKAKSTRALLPPRSAPPKRTGDPPSCAPPITLNKPRFRRNLNTPRPPDPHIGVLGERHLNPYFYIPIGGPKVKKTWVVPRRAADGKHRGKIPRFSLGIRRRSDGQFGPPGRADNGTEHEPEVPTREGRKATEPAWHQQARQNYHGEAKNEAIGK